MPKRLFKKFSPHPDTITQNKYMRYLGSSLFLPALWHFNRHSVAKAFAIGLACMWIPFPGQSIFAAALAILFRANIPMSVALVFVTNPVTGPPMFYGAYVVGARLLDQPQIPHFEMNIEWLEQTLGQIWEPMVVGCLVVAVVSALIGYYGIQFFWRFHVNQKLRDRRDRQENGSLKAQTLITPSLNSDSNTLAAKMKDEQRS
ncbi:DUF2062 domain-containing protein [uncultured Thiothrix sp.]|uniref:DUF2062 domain-containing protein n=1 Tax=uncultured Thiothrix sp. TaxID=223185 RepID=UPI00261AA054|nr:DUF2062 domain-containing protein [uncultured Thiothrix sp.]HMT92513.1 DUF2062 domain-containing protein [Thiolinea sp.]